MRRGIRYRMEFAGPRNWLNEFCKNPAVALVSIDQVPFQDGCTIVDFLDGGIWKVNEGDVVKVPLWLIKA